jgi:hypothetical protein
MRLALAEVVPEARLVDDFHLPRRRFSTGRDTNSHEAEDRDQKKCVPLHEFSFLFRQIALTWLPGITV